jgi:hypothetical protein
MSEQIEELKPKTEKELERERARELKLAKFAEKQKKLEAQKAASLAKQADSDVKKKAGQKTTEITDYEWQTGPGEKKGFRICSSIS